VTHPRPGIADISTAFLSLFVSSCQPFSQSQPWHPVSATELQLWSKHHSQASRESGNLVPAPNNLSAAARRPEDRMSDFRTKVSRRLRLVASVTITILFSTVFLTGTVSLAQNQQMLDKLMTLKTNQEANKQKLAQYTWTETETISIKGDVKDTKVYQVSMVNGQPQKNLVSNQQAQQGGGGGRLKQHVVEKKKSEFEEYGQQVSALAKQYTTPNPQALMQAKDAGNVSLQPGGGTVGLVIKNYIKPGDLMTYTINAGTKQIQSVNVQSYLNDPSDKVTINATFAQLPDGTNHVASSLVNGVSKQLTVNDVNSNYQKQ
jgi:hypothetical protein